VLPPDRQIHLLLEVGEMRRIEAARREMALRSPRLEPPSARELAAACGYGAEEGEPEAEGAAIDRLQKALDRGYAAREQLITTNLGLVRHVVQSVAGGGAQSLGREDLVQEGAIGLARAVDRWDPEIGGKFSTYAYYWIRAAVLRGVAQRDELVRVPEHMRSAIAKLERAARALGIENFFSDRRWRDAREAKELAEAAGVTRKQLEQAWRVQDRRRNTLSFETWMEQGKDVSSVGSSASPMASAELQDLWLSLAKFLRPRELEALTWRYGLNGDTEPAISGDRSADSPTSRTLGSSSRRDYAAEAEEKLFGGREAAAAAVSVPSRGRWGEAMTFAEVGKRMQVSKEYTRRLCHAALEKLRRAAKSGELDARNFQF
jgi:RNA polymerase sigma factor (sigma-70 family)